MPSTTCIVPECSRKGDHILPKDPVRRGQWIHAIRRGETKFKQWNPPSEYSYIDRFTVNPAHAHKRFRWSTQK